MHTAADWVKLSGSNALCLSYRESRIAPGASRCVCSDDGDLFHRGWLKVLSARCSFLLVVIGGRIAQQDGVCKSEGEAGSEKFGTGAYNAIAATSSISKQVLSAAYLLSKGE